jgi:short-subunit dehydrogenase
MDGPLIPHMTSYKVALKGVEGALKGKRRVVPGILNYIFTMSPLVIPRFLQLRILNYIQNSKNTGKA